MRKGVGVVIAGGVVVGLVGVGAWVMGDDGDGDSGEPGRAEPEQAVGGENDDDVASDADLIMFLEPAVSDEQLAAIEGEVSGHGDVEEYAYVDDAASEAEFERLFAENEAMLERQAMDPDLVPTSYRLRLRSTEPAVVDAVVDDMTALAGVTRVAPVEVWADGAGTAGG